MTDPTPLIALAGLILVKESGIPIPVPGDLIVIGAGVAASRGDLDPATGLAALIVASIVGGFVQFALLRSVARPAVLRLLGRLGSADRLDPQAERLRRGGARPVAIARTTPGVRIVAIAASAIAGLGPVPFLLGLIVGNGLFIAAHFGLGFLLGEPILVVVGGVLGLLAVAGLVLGGVGLVGWAILRRGRRPATNVVAWADACCPACLGLAAVSRS